MFPIMDVSRWQGNIDWAKVKASGLVSGVMLRALGNSDKYEPSKPYIDPTFERNYAECKRLGIPCGVYYYCKAVNTAEADAELALLRKVLTGKTLQLPVAVDIEDAYVQRPTGQADPDGHCTPTRWALCKAGASTPCCTPGCILPAITCT